MIIMRQPYHMGCLINILSVEEKMMKKKMMMMMMM